MESNSSPPPKKQESNSSPPPPEKSPKKPLEESGPSFKEKRIREITLIYYSQPLVRKAIFEFSENRECIPRYYEGFGKRPDTFQYEQDILEQVRRGTTSFHCSEELWEDPLEISTELSPTEFNDLRIGWDMLLDIDSLYLEYSKIYTKLLVDTLKSHGIENIGVKFSGSKGFHVIIPWKAFPEKVYGQETKDMFPEWPRLICGYLSEVIQSELSDKIFENESLKEIAEKTGIKEEDLEITECRSCNRPATKKFLITWNCPYCKTEIQMQNKTKRIPVCPDCRKQLTEISRREIDICEFCNINSNKNPELFSKTRENTDSLIVADLILVSPRHLFRMPYSLHEKTALSSIVIDKDKVEGFQIKDAKPFKAEIKSYYPEAKPGEAKELLLKALDWQEQKDKEEKTIEKQKSSISPSSTLSKPSKQEYNKVSIPNPTEDIFPPCIKSISQGIKQDGRKRALFILINFFKSLGLTEEELEKRITEWNEKNYNPLKKGYIVAQLNWYRRHPARLPPNCDKPNYKDLTFCKPDELCRQIKNPVSYAVKMFFRKG